MYPKQNEIDSSPSCVISHGRVARRTFSGWKKKGSQSLLVKSSAKFSSQDVSPAVKGLANSDISELVANSGASTTDPAGCRDVSVTSPQLQSPPNWSPRSSPFRRRSNDGIMCLCKTRKVEAINKKINFYLDARSDRSKLIAKCFDNIDILTRNLCFDCELEPLQNNEQAYERLEIVNVKTEDGVVCSLPYTDTTTVGEFKKGLGVQDHVLLVDDTQLEDSQLVSYYDLDSKTIRFRRTSSSNCAHLHVNCESLTEPSLPVDTSLPEVNHHSVVTNDSRRLMDFIHMVSRLDSHDLSHSGFFSTSALENPVGKTQVNNSAFEGSCKLRPLSSDDKPPSRLLDERDQEGRVSCLRDT